MDGRRRFAVERVRIGQALVCAGLLLAPAVHATLATTAIFGSHMVLQRRMKVPVWGTGASGEAVTLTFNGQTKTATASRAGTWKVVLDSMSAGGPYAMTIKGTNTLTYSDVMVGEVWQCAGQSNMDTRLNYSEYSFADSIAKANYPKLRFITMRQPGQTVQWQQVSSTTAGSLSATGYFFGRNILDNLGGVAVGLVVTAVGGTTISEWMDSSSIAGNATLKADTTSGTMYDAWVKPVVGYAIAGTAWYQGENDCTGGRQAYYAERLSILMKAWRTQWGQGDFPFLVAQLAHVHGKQTAATGTSNYATVREAQRSTVVSATNAWLSVNIDIGDTATLHYADKPTAGKRLGLLARGGVYKESGLNLWQSPQPTAAWISGSTARILFTQTGTGLKISDSTVPTGFAIAGSNGTWYWGNASIHGDTVVVSSSSVASPTQVRYAWADYPIRNLHNSAALPATPFHLALSSSAPTTSVDEVASEVPGWHLDGRRIAANFPAGASRAVLETISPSGRILSRAEVAAGAGSASWNLDGHGVELFRIGLDGRLFASGKVVLP